MRARAVGINHVALEVGSLDGEPRTRMHQKFAGTDRWLTLERIAKGANVLDKAAADIPIMSGSKGRF